MLNDSIDNIRLDLNRQRVRACIYVRKGDTKSRSIHVSITSNGMVYPLDNVILAELQIHKPDGKVCDQPMVVNGNELQYTFRTQDVNVEGEAVCQISLTFSDGATISSPEFYMNVYNKVLDNQTIESQNEYSVLVDELSKANDLRQYVESSVENITTLELSCTASASSANESEINAASSAEEAKSAASIIEEKSAIAVSSANSAKTSEENAKKYETTASSASLIAIESMNHAKSSEDSAKESETNAKLYMEKASSSELSASESASDASHSKDVAEECVRRTHASELAAASSELNAKNSEEKCAEYAALAPEVENNALLAATSARNAKISEDNALLYEQQANEHDINCNAHKAAAAISEANAKTSEEKAKEYLDKMSQGTLMLGNTSKTAFRGDYGEIAYEHSQLMSGNPHGTTYSDVGADAFGSAAGAYENATAYTDQKIADLINGAPETLDTLRELADAFTEDHSLVELLNESIGSKTDEIDFSGHANNETIHVTASEKDAWNSKASNAVATQSANGLMSSEDKTKLDGVEEGANKYVHPVYTVRESGLYKITVDATGHVSAVTAVTKDDITALGIPGQDTNTTYSTATQSANGLMSSEDKTKLDGIATGANKYTHPSYTAKTSGLYKITVDATGHVSELTAVTKEDITALGIPASDTNTKNTAGSTDSSSKLFLIGATSQAANPQTYSHDTAYVGTDGCLYSGGKKCFAPTEVTGTLSAGATSLTLSNSAITTSSTVEVFTSVYGVCPTAVSVSAGKVVLTFDAQSSNISVKVRVS